MNTQSREETLLAQVKEGMVVYDDNFERLGTVTDVYFGTSSDENRGIKTNPVPLPVDNTKTGNELKSIDPLTAAAGNSGGLDTFENQLQPFTRSWLVQQGFVKAKGWRVFGAVWYITPDQIAMIVGNNITLNV